MLYYKARCSNSGSSFKQLKSPANIIYYSLLTVISSACNSAIAAFRLSVHAKGGEIYGTNKYVERIIVLEGGYLNCDTI